MADPYQILSTLARHEERTTFVAVDTLTGRRVILEEFLYDLTREPADLDRGRRELLREARFAMDLDHPGVVRVERVIPEEDRLRVVLEYLEGCQSLRERLVQGLPGQDEALSIAIQIAGALAYAHGKGIVHRDVRPENILLAGNVAKISNFGLARKAERGRPTSDLRELAADHPHAAPELRRDERPQRADARVDVYSLGAVLYEMLTGQLPRQEDDLTWEPPSEFVRGVPAALDDTLRRALRIDPVLRLSTMNAFRERLLQARDRLPEHSDSPGLRYGARRLAKRTPNSLIYQAIDAKLQRPVALKRVLVDPALTPDARMRELEAVLREAAAASRLVHPAIVRILDHFVEDDDAFIVMEWLEGQSLREVLEGQGGTLGVAQALDLAAAVAGALAFAHQRGVVHRGLKPEDVVVHQGRVTVLDFGTAAVPTIDPTSERGDGAARGEVAAGARTLVAAARYVAPEVLKKEAFDGRADVFSLGVILYELLTGSVPYPAEVIRGAYSAPVVAGGVTAASAINLEVSAALSSALSRAVAVDPARRFESLEAFVAALDAARGGSRRRRGARKLAAWALGALAIAGVGIASAWWLLPPGAGRPSGSPELATPIASSDLAPQAALPAASGIATDSGDVPVAAGQATLLPAQVPTPGALTPPPAGLPAAESEALPTSRATVEGSASPSGVAGGTIGTAGAAPSGKISWASSPQSIDGVTVEIVGVDPETRTVRLRISNDSSASVRLLDRPGLARVIDSAGNDFSSAIDYPTVSSQIQEIDPGQDKVEGSFTIDRPLDTSADNLVFTLSEDGGSGRVFTLAAHRLVQ